MKERITPYSGTMKVSAKEAMERLDLQDKIHHGESYNLWASVKSIDAFKDRPDDFRKQYGISLDEAKQAKEVMYGD